MIVSVIPYFLLANLPENTVWNNGPEYNFSFYVEVYSIGLKNDTLVKAFNVTNELICQPKDTNILNCEIKHVDFTFYQYGKNIDELSEEYRADESVQNIYKGIPFEIKFNEKGAQSLIVSEDTKSDLRMNLMKSIAHMFNVGINLGNVKFELTDKPLKFKENMNSLLEECEAEVAIYLMHYEGVENNYNLDLVPPIEQLSNRQFIMGKFRNSSSCLSAFKFSWSKLIFDDLKINPQLKATRIKDFMQVNSNEFKSVSDIHMETTNTHEDQIKVRESFSLSLTDVYEAQRRIPAIKNPVIINFDVKEENV